MKHSLKEQVKGSLIRPLRSRAATGLSPTFKIPLIESVSSVPSGLVSTFARNSTATYIDDDGLLQTAGINVPRFQNGRYLCEPAGTNLLRYSQSLDLSGWTVTGLSVTEDVNKDSFKLTNTTTDTCYALGPNVTFSSNTYYTQSVLLEKGNTNFASITFGTPFNSTLVPYAILNLNTGTIVQEVNCTAKITEYTTGKYRCSITAMAGAGATTSGSIITPCREDSLRLKGVVGDYIYANKIQTETGTQATSYIPTTSAPVTRAADSLHYEVGDVITQGQGSLYCEVTIEPNSNLQRVAYLSDGTTTNRIFITLNPNLVAYITYAGVTQAAINPGTIPSNVLKCLLTYKRNEVFFYANGVNVGTDITCEIPTNISMLSIGCSPSGSEQMNGEIGNIKYFKEVLTSAQAIKLTTL